MISGRFFDVVAIRLQDRAGTGAKLICHGEQGGILLLSAHSREHTRGGASASSVAENLVS
jgi:hypothetical protein